MVYLGPKIKPSGWFYMASLWNNWTKAQKREGVSSQAHSSGEGNVFQVHGGLILARKGGSLPFHPPCPPVDMVWKVWSAIPCQCSKFHGDFWCLKHAPPEKGLHFQLYFYNCKFAPNVHVILPNLKCVQFWVQCVFQILQDLILCLLQNNITHHFNHFS